MKLTEAKQQFISSWGAFGTHWGLLYFVGEDSKVMHELLKRQEELDFYV